MTPDEPEFPEDAADFLEGDDGESHGDPDPEGDARIGLVAMENGWGDEAADA